MTEQFRDLNLPKIGMGTWNIGGNPSQRNDEIAALRFGIDNGINVIDTAEMYGSGKSESLIGAAIKGYDRSKLYLISKFYPYHATPALERASLEKTLQRLGTDYLDLYLLHWRGLIRLSETVLGLQKLQKEGLIRHWGVSNFDTDDMKELLALPGGDECFVNEDLYNLEQRGIEFDLLPWQNKKGINFIGYSPFNSGDGNTMRVTKNLKHVARNHQASPHQIMLAWAIRQGNVLSIPKAGKISHMKENIAAQDIKLTSEDLKLINADFLPPTSKQPLATI